MRSDQHDEHSLATAFVKVGEVTRADGRSRDVAVKGAVSEQLLEALQPIYAQGRHGGRILTSLTSAARPGILRVRWPIVQWQDTRLWIWESRFESWSASQPLIAVRGLPVFRRLSAIEPLEAESVSLQRQDACRTSAVFAKENEIMLTVARDDLYLAGDALPRSQILELERTARVHAQYVSWRSALRVPKAGKTLFHRRRDPLPKAAIPLRLEQDA